MKHKSLYILGILLTLTIGLNAQVQMAHSTKLMGAKFDFVAVGVDTPTVRKALSDMEHEVRRIEYLISDWIDTTQVSWINKYAGIAPVKVDKEVLELAQRAIAISQLTNGAFDISFAAMEKVWKFDGSMTKLPDSATIQQAKSKVGYQHIEIDTIHSTIFLKKRGMKIGFGALGEGYAADKCKDLMLAQGVKAGLVNGSGDIRCWGVQANGEPWLIAFEHPMDNSNILAAIPIADGAITTSGSYQKYAEIDGVRYAHIINPATGYPAQGLISVTIIGPSALTANSLSTSVMVLGREKGLTLLQSFPEYQCLMITDDGSMVLSENVDWEQWRYQP